MNTDSPCCSSPFSTNTRKAVVNAIGILTFLAGFSFTGAGLAAPAPPPRKSAWSPVMPAQPPSRSSPAPAQPQRPANNSGRFFPAAVPLDVADLPPDAPVVPIPLPTTPAPTPALELPPKGTVMEDKYTAPQYRRAGKEFESILAEDKGWHSVWGRVMKVLSPGSLMVKGFYCSKKVDSPAYILSRGMPVPCTFLLSNCPQTHAAGQTLQKIYRAKFLSQATFKDEVTASNYVANIFDHGVFPTAARARTNSPAKTTSASKL